MGEIIYQITVGETEFQQLERALRQYIGSLEKERNKANNKLEIQFIPYKIESAMRALKAMRKAWVNNLYES